VSGQERPILSIDLATPNKTTTSCVTAQAVTFKINQIVSWNKTSRVLANVFQDASFVVVRKHSLHVDVAHDHHGRRCKNKVVSNKFEHPTLAFLLRLCM
jgi:hypothetical protein